MADNITGTTILGSTGNIISTTSNWIRQYRVTVYMHAAGTASAPASGATIEQIEAFNKNFAQQQAGDKVLDVSDLRIQFSVQRFAMYYPNQALITIYNLTSTTESSIVQEGYRVVVEAGYKSNYGQIFDGTVLMCSRSKQNGTDYILQILALDGNQFINEGYISFTYAKGQNARDNVNAITNKATSPITLGYASPKLDSIQFSKGGVVHGQAKSTLSDYAKSINGTWFVDNGKLYIISYSDDASKFPMGWQAVELSEKTGLLGNPQQVGQGVNARMLLNPKIMPYGLVHISNVLITNQLVDIGTYSQGITTPWMLDPEGIYRVISVVFTGDTRGDEWYADIATVTQTGNIPETLQDSSQTVN